MQLIFTHFFRPRWQHPKPGIRRKAIRKLKPDLPSDQQILQQLARLDQDIEVRCSALDKLLRPETLREIAEQDPTPQVRREAMRRFCQLICEPGPQQLSSASRAAQLDQLSDPDILTHICLNADSADIQLAAVRRIQLESSLHQVIVNSDSFAIRQAAAEGIQSADTLDELIRHSRQRDKRLYRLFKDRREQQKRDARALAEQQSLCDSICRNLQKLSAEPAGPHYQARVGAQSQKWDELSEVARQPRSADYQQALQQCLLNQQNFEQVQQQQQLEQQNIARQQQLLEQFEQQLKQCYREELPSQQNLQQQLQQAGHEWSALVSELPAGSPHQQRYDRCIDQASQLLESLIRFEQQQPQLEQLLRSDTPARQLQQVLDSIRWPASLSQPPSIRQALEKIKEEQRLKQQKSEEQNLRARQLDELLEQLETTLAQGQLQEAGQQLKQLKTLGDKPGYQFRGAARQRYQRLNGRYLELSNWQTFATRPKLQQLCEQMEQLATAELENNDRATQIKELQQQWKQLDSATTPNQLRSRFQQANQAAYAPCQQYYDQQRDQRRQNLQQRQQLLEQLQQALSATIDGQQNVRELAVIYRHSKQQWRQHSPVDRAPGKKLQSDFNQLLNRVSQCLDKDQLQNAEAKVALLNQARQLLEDNQQTADPETLGDALQQAKQLQKQWRDIGPAQRRQEQQLWRDFREACNQLFALREQFSAGDNSSDSESVLPPDNDLAAIERRHQLCEALEMQLLMDGQLKISDEQHGAWQQGKFPSAPYKEQLQQRFSLLQQLQQQPEQADQLLLESEQQLRLLCIQLEILTGATSPEADQILRMEYQMAHLKEALEQRRSEPSGVEILALQKDWHCTPFNQCHAELRSRFDRLLETVA